MANEIMVWSGGPCPVEPDVKVDIKMRDGSQYFGIKASDVLDWSHRPGKNGLEFDRDIVAYRVQAPPAPMD